ncbi:MAG: UvrD-helicase domain-containing protein [Alkalispirochaeta sp.]
MGSNTIVLDDQQQAAVDVRENVVVSAGAGSGKTRVLTERYMDMLRSGVDVSQILTLTFTRKAAAEMFQRIYRRLSEITDSGAITDPGEMGAARDTTAIGDVRDLGEPAGTAVGTDIAEHLRDQLQRFDEAQISTLDSFCAGILRDSTTRFGLPPQIQSDDMQLQREAEQLALQFLTRHGDDSVVGAFARQLGITRTLSELLVPLATRHFRLSAPIDFDQLLERQLQWLANRRAEVEREIAAAVDALNAAAPEKGNAAEVCAAVNGAADDFSALATVLETIDRRRLPRGDEATEFKEWINTLLAKKSSKRSGLLPRWIALRDTAARTDEMGHLYGVLAPFQQEVLAQRRRRGLLSHQEVMELAVQALRDDLELRQAYKERFRYIMIDEFQDNNAVQRDLLFLLSEARSSAVDRVPRAEELERDKLFFVGDQKQSIYRFRGADVAVFRRLSRDIDGLLTLDTNYRSEPVLIQFFNALFPRVFGNPEYDWDAEFEPLLHRVVDAHRDPGITVAWVTEPSEEDSRLPAEPGDEPADLAYSEAGWIAGEIRRLTVTEGRYSPGQIAILYRTSGNQQKLERMLRREGIAYRTQAVRSLFTEAPAADLYALLQLCFYPADRAALAAFLRSPLVMLSDSAVAQILAGELSAEDLLGADALPAPWLGPQDATKLERAGELYRHVRQQVDRTPLYEIVRGIWEDEGYRYALLHRSSDHPYLEHLAYLNALALRYSDRPAIEFVDYLRDQLGETEKIDELELPGGDDAVQLMTIHKSKGLEFPVVFVSGMGGGVGNHQQILRQDSNLGLTVRLPDRDPHGGGVNVFEEHARQEEELQELAELRRIMYVAMTRAEERLYLTASVRRRKSPRPMLDLFCGAAGFDPLEGTIAADLEPLVTLQRMPVLTERDLREHAVPQTARRTHTDARAVAEHTATAEFPAERSEITPTDINVMLRENEKTSSPNQREFDFAAKDPSSESGDASLLGTLTHALLERAVPAAAAGAAAAGPARAAGAAAATGPAAAPTATRDGAGRSQDPAVTREEWLSFPSWAERAVGPHSADAVREPVLSESWDLAQRFLQSEFFHSLLAELTTPTAGATGTIDTELAFVLVPEEVGLAISGSMDLVVETVDTVWVVDYKTDHDLIPEHYAGQMSVYRAAAERIFRKPVELRLFGLRQGIAHTVSDRYADILRYLQLPQYRSGGVGSHRES